MKKISENTKITLTIGQLKKLVNESKSENLMPKFLANRFEKHGKFHSKEGMGLNAPVEAIYFFGSYTFLATEAEQEGDDWTLFGYATIDGSDWEWGYQSLNELSNTRGRFGLRIERDMYYKPGSNTVRDCLRRLGIDADSL